MNHSLLLAALLVSCSGSSASPTEKPSPIALPGAKSTSDVTQMVKESSPLLLKTFRPRMDFLSDQTSVSESQGLFSVVVELEYHSFLKQNARVARLSFSLSPDGQVSQCRIQDPIQKAAEVSCSQLEAKITQLFEPYF